MRAFLAALLLAGVLSAAPYDQVDCWMVTDTIAHAEVGVDTVTLGGQVFAMSIKNGSADTILWLTQTLADETTAVSDYFPIAATATITVSTGLQSYSAVESLYASWADSAGVSDIIYIWCWGYK